MFKKIAIVAVVAFAAVIAVGVARGRDWKVERSIVINAPPSTIAPLLTDFEKGWTQWSIWSSMDPTAKWTYAGTPGAVGHAMTWGGPQVGSGTLTIQSIAPTSIVIVGSIESDDENDRTTFTLAPDGAATKLTWTDEGKAPVVVGGLFKGKLEQLLGAQFEQNLAKLKEVAEKAPAPTPTPPTETPPTTPPTETPPTETPPTTPPTETPPTQTPPTPRTTPIVPTTVG